MPAECMSLDLPLFLLEAKPFQNPVDILWNSLRDMATQAIRLAPNAVVAVVVLILTWVIVKIFAAVVPKISHRFHLRTSLEELIQTLGKALIWILGLLIAATIVFPGLSPSKVLGAAGLASVAVGLAFKDIFQNFFAGILLLWKFPFEPGDFIECADVKGKVIETELRLTTIRDTSGELIIVPNSYLVENPIDVLTDKDRRRVELVVGVGYGEDVEKSADVIRKAVKSCDFVDQDRALDVLAKEFGDSSVNFDVLFWAGATPMEQRQARAQVVTAIKAALDNAGIEIPFPYRTLTFSEPLELNQLPGDNS